MNRVAMLVCVLTSGLYGAGCASSAMPGDAGDAGDASDAPPTPLSLPFQSGTRLRAQVLDGANGAEFFETWIDTQLGIPCMFRLASDGVWRCLPNSNDSTTFIDAACTQVAARHDSYNPTCSSQLPGWVYGPAPDTTASCETGRSGVLYQTASTPINVTTVYYPSTNGCAVASNMNTEPLYPATPAALDTFVAGTVSTVALTSQIAATVLQAEDGARQVLAPHDVRHDRDCWPVGRYLARDDGRCLPDVGWDVGNFFGDATCSTPVAVYFDNCTPLAVIGLRGLDRCGVATVSSVGARAPAVSYSNAFGQNACSANAASDHNWFIGDPVLPADFGALDVVRAGTGRLRARYYAAGTSALTPTGSMRFYDSDLASLCEPQIVGDAKRCIPPSVGIHLEFVFSDAACTHTVSSVYRGVNSCAEVPLVAELRAVPGCAGSTDLYSLGERYTGSVFRLEGTQCVAVADTTDTEFFEPGMPADASAYAALVDRTE